MTMKEFITREPQDEDAWVCKCGNMAHTDGFSACDKHGNEIEPDEKWDDLFLCLRCDRIIKMDTLQVVGKRQPESPDKQIPSV